MAVTARTTGCETTTADLLTRMAMVSKVLVWRFRVRPVKVAAILSLTLVSPAACTLAVPLNENTKNARTSHKGVERILREAADDTGKPPSGP
jgi:hypothetical protein